MIITDNRNNTTLIEPTQFQAVEEEKHTLHIYLSGGYTMDIGVNEWARLQDLYEQRYQCKE